jgi:hypothetical protein
MPPKTKADLLKEYRALCDVKRVTLDGVYSNSNKSDIQNAIDCLSCSDELMDKYMTVIELKYPNMHRAISKSNFKRHSYNRLFVYNTARLALA